MAWTNILKSNTFGEWRASHNAVGFALDALETAFGIDTAKLSGIEPGATADQTKADIDALEIDAGSVDGLDGTDLALLDTDNDFTGRQNLLDFSETASAIATTGAVTLDTSLATYFYNVSTTGAITFTFSNPALTGKVTTFTLELFGGGTNAPVWPASVKWPDGTEPTWSAGKDVVSFSTRDGGTTWNGYYAGGAFA